MIEISILLAVFSVSLAAGFNVLEHYQQKRLEKARKQLEQTWERDRGRT
jgi:hypothetical protein